MAVGRFQVMAVLQAARAHKLGMPIEMAKSWGLNRAIFYAAAKRGYIKPGAKPGKRIPSKGKKSEKRPEMYMLGDDGAYQTRVKGKTYFVIHDQVQTEENFQRQIEARLGEKFQQAWKEAIGIVSQYDNEIMKSQTAFFDEVYKPRRDELAEKWSEMSQTT